jgi:phosphohistidine phosphatase
MKTLYLLRHAKSAWNTLEGDDHERPLAPRGTKAARAVGLHLAERKAHVDLVLCSTAKRAVDTLELVLESLPPPPPLIERERGLYLCGAHVLLERLRDVPDTAVGLMLVAHNPDMHELAAHLCGEASDADEAALSSGYPAGALALFLFGVARWRDLEPGSGRLVEYVLPRNLA